MNSLYSGLRCLNGNSPSTRQRRLKNVSILYARPLPVVSWIICRGQRDTAALDSLQFTFHLLFPTLVAMWESQSNREYALIIGGSSNKNMYTIHAKIQPLEPGRHVAYPRLFQYISNIIFKAYQRVSMSSHYLSYVYKTKSPKFSKNYYSLIIYHRSPFASQVSSVWPSRRR